MTTIFRITKASYKLSDNLLHNSDGLAIKLLSKKMRIKKITIIVITGTIVLVFGKKYREINPSKTICF